MVQLDTVTLVAQTINADTTTLMPLQGGLHAEIGADGTFWSIRRRRLGGRRRSSSIGPAPLSSNGQAGGVKLDGKVAAITGGGRGIGREIALRFVAEGAAVALAAPEADEIRTAAASIERAGGRALAVVTDIREPDQVASFAETVTAELGVPDVLVNNSGIAGPNSVLWTLDPADWDETIRINLTGTFLCCRAFLPAMVQRGQGSIVVIGSTTGKRPEAGRTPYAASKLGLVGLVRTLAWELGEHGIRVNLISPGSVEGPRIEAVMVGRAQAQGKTVEEIRADVAASSPLGRLTAPGDIASAAVFLASEDAASITGEDLNVTAGRAMY